MTCLLWCNDMTVPGRVVVIGDAGLDLRLAVLRLPLPARR